jgi:D-alanyl-lipoteichoic acid acyltransferase DltB (MBOAT superfamily)
MDLPGFLVDLVQILIFILISSLIGVFKRQRWRRWALFVISVMAIFWLQPASSIRHLDFWFPTLSLGITILSWVVTTAKSRNVTREDQATIVVILFLLFVIGLTRFTGDVRLTPTTPPGIESIVGIIVVAGTSFFLLSKRRGAGSRLIYLTVFLLIALFIVLKTQPLGDKFSQGLRTITGQSTEFASSIDLGWLGFSYLAFRLLHTLRDTVLGKMPTVSLRDYVSYALFFPALSAGPIDRVERFQKDIERHHVLTAAESTEAGQRIAVGIFKKFVLADTLALFALNSTNALQAKSGFWLWVMLYAYALRLYLDFSGYTDIAIGIGQLVGVKLPENFNRPYLKSSITAFWNSWHMTLAGWFRAYFFNPLTRALRKLDIELPAALIILTTQVSTMALIGLWHGVAWNYLLWGVWHGAGLFLHNRWVNLQRTRPEIVPMGILSSKVGQTLSVLLTFQFVVVGWIWFVIPDVSQGWTTLLSLFGI